MPPHDPEQRLAAARRVFVALDVEGLAQAEALVDRLDGIVTRYKIGNQLFTASGPAAVEAVQKRGAEVFLDLKFHDIPNTVAGAAREADPHGRVHVQCPRLRRARHDEGGRRRRRPAARELKVRRPLAIAVTVLTSLDRAALQRELGVAASVEGHVLRLADLAREAGLDGCVASPTRSRRSGTGSAATGSS